MYIKVKYVKTQHIRWISENLSLLLRFRNLSQQLETGVRCQATTAMYHIICENSSNCVPAHTLQQKGLFRPTKARSVKVAIFLKTDLWAGISVSLSLSLIIKAGIFQSADSICQRMTD